MFNLPIIPDAALKALVFMVMLIVGDALLGIFLAIMTKSFDRKKFPDFLKNICLFIGGLVVLFIIGLWMPDMMAVFLTATAGLTIMYVADIKNKISRFITAFTNRGGPGPGVTV